MNSSSTISLSSTENSSSDIAMLAILCVFILCMVALFYNYFRWAMVRAGELDSRNAGIPSQTARAPCQVFHIPVAVVPQVRPVTVSTRKHQQKSDTVHDKLPPTYDSLFPREIVVERPPLYEETSISTSSKRT